MIAGMAVMSPRVAFLALIAIIVLLAVFLLKSGIVQVEIGREDEEEVDFEQTRKEIKELDDDSLINRILKGLLWVVEKLEEREARKEAKAEAEEIDEDGEKG